MYYLRDHGGLGHVGKSTGGEKGMDSEDFWRQHKKIGCLIRREPERKRRIKSNSKFSI